MNFPDPKDWSLYWRRPTVTSFGDLFPENYDGAILEFWKTQLVGEFNHVVDIACGNGALTWLANEIINSRSANRSRYRVIQSYAGEDDGVMPNVVANIGRKYT